MFEIVDGNNSMRIPKFGGYNLVGRMLCFRVPWMTFAGQQPLSGQLLRFRRVMMYMCFIRCHKSAQKLVLVAFHHCQIVLWKSDTFVFSMDARKTRVPTACLLVCLFICINSSMKWFTHSFEMPIMLTNLINFIFRIVFWSYWLLWSSWTGCIICAGTVATKFSKPVLNRCININGVPFHNILSVDEIKFFPL